MNTSDMKYLLMRLLLLSIAFGAGRLIHLVMMLVME